VDAGGCFLEQEQKPRRHNARNLTAMKHFTSLPALAIAALVLAVPATGFARHRSNNHCRPVVVRSFVGPQFGYGGFWPNYYADPGFGWGFNSAPVYYRSSAVYYRGIPRARYNYRESSSYSDDLAVDVQRTLARRGYYRGAIDGDVGPGTRAAIRSFQYTRGMTVTGRIDSTLLRALGLG
jgi:hypothetical protein